MALLFLQSYKNITTLKEGGFSSLNKMDRGSKK
jgi:hypothetical protein